MKSGSNLERMQQRNQWQASIEGGPLSTSGADSQVGAHEMAERQSVLKRAPARPALAQKLERAKTVVLTEDQLRQQRASFVYGNAPKGSRITLESARRSTSDVRVSPPKSN